MKTILYSVSTGYIARNLLRTGVLEKLLKLDDIRIVVLTPGYDDENFVKEFSFSERIFIEKLFDVDRLPDLMDRLIWKFWLLAHDNKFFLWLHNFLMKVQIRKRYYNKYHRLYGSIFDKYKPDLVIGGSLGVYSRRDIPVYAEAKKRGIKTLVLIHSWDNLAKRKGPIWFKSDSLGVWNEFQKKEAQTHHFYKDEDIYLLGPAHFDIYWKKDTFMPREEFFRKMGLDPEKKLITMVATCPGLLKNAYIVDILLDALRKKKFAYPVYLICRPTPTSPDKNELDFSKFYNQPDIIVDNQARHSLKLGWNPNKQELYHFANLVKHTDVQVSIVSTATIEAAILDRPVVNVAFSTVEPELFKKFIIDSVYRHHFKIIKDIGATYLATNPDDLIDGVNKYLSNPWLHSKERQKVKQTLVYKADGMATERIYQAILGFLR